MPHQHQDNYTLLRRALQANAAFSLVSGVVFVLFAKPISAAIGLAMPWVLVAIGVSLLLFAAGLVRNSLRPAVNIVESRIAVASDLAWVVGTGVVLAFGFLNSTGNWAALIIADIVLVFAALQYWGIRRALRTSAAPLHVHS